MIKKAIRYIRNGTKFLLKNSDFCFSEKIKLINMISVKRDLVVHNLLLDKLKATDDGQRFFLINGVKIYFQPHYNIYDYNYFLRGTTQVLAETFLFPVFFNSKVGIKKGEIIFDIGANIGSATLLFSRIVGNEGRVFAFEPVTYDIIIKNLQQNNIKNIEVVPKGISNQTGRVEIEKSDFCNDSSICKREYTKDYYTSSEMIEVTTLDNFYEQSGLDRIDFIKLDIEGAEELAIRGAKKIIYKFHPKWSISSYHTDFNNEPQHNKLVKLLKEFGYRIEEENNFHIYAW